MDESRTEFEARKAKADAVMKEKLEAKRKKIAYDRQHKIYQFRLGKQSSMTDKALETLVNPDSKIPSTSVGRPGERLVFKPENDEAKNIAFFKKHDAMLKFIEKVKERAKNKGKGPSP